MFLAYVFGNIPTKYGQTYGTNVATKRHYFHFGILKFALIKCQLHVQLITVALKSGVNHRGFQVPPGLDTATD